MHLSAGGNVVVPAYLTLLTKGYSVTRPPSETALLATGPLGTFVADDPITLLGLISIAEVRGEAWQASGAEIDDYLSRFDADER